MVNTINAIPEFTTEDAPSSNDGIQEVKEPIEEQPVEETPEIEEKDTPSAPPLPEKKPAEALAPVEDVEKQDKVNQGLLYERTKLLKEISELRGQKRELKQKELAAVQEQIDELQGVHPDDVAVIEKILRNKGYITKEEQQKMFYSAVEQEKLTSFLEKYPEYKPENDPGDVRWSALKAEYDEYKRPSDPHKTFDLLEKAHRNVALPSPVINDRKLEVRKQQVKTASVGAGGVQRSSSNKTLEPSKRLILEMGGWSEEDIKKIESRL